VHIEKELGGQAAYKTLKLKFVELTTNQNVKTLEYISFCMFASNMAEFLSVTHSNL